MKSKMNHKPKSAMPAKITTQPGKGGGAMQTGKMAAKTPSSMKGVRSTTKNGKYC